MDSNFTGGSENPVYELVGKTDPSYSMVNTGTINRENIYTDVDTSTRNNGSKNSKGEDNTKNKKPICLIAILVIIITGCFIALFLELANLKSELSSFKQTLPSERAQQLNTSIEGSFSNIECRFEDIGIDQLNISVQVQERLQDTVNQLNVQFFNYRKPTDRIRRHCMRIFKTAKSSELMLLFKLKKHFKIK